LEIIFIKIVGVGTNNDYERRNRMYFLLKKIKRYDYHPNCEIDKSSQGIRFFNFKKLMKKAIKRVRSVKKSKEVFDACPGLTIIESEARARWKKNSFRTARRIRRAKKAKNLYYYFYPDAREILLTKFPGLLGK
jgi:hypothetical protein